MAASPQFEERMDYQPEEPYNPASGSSDRSVSLTPPSNSMNCTVSLSSPSSKSEEYRQLFRLPPEQLLVSDFNCAYQESILCQGHLYLFLDYICFYSNIFGFETKKLIPIRDITLVKKAKIAGIFPNAIEIFSGEKRFFFASFLSRDEAYKLINDGVELHRSGSASGTLTDRQEGSTSLEADALIQDAIHTDEPSTSFSTINSEPVTEDVPLTSEPVLLDETVEEGNGSENPENSLQFQWMPQDLDAPDTPEHYTKVAESNFPISVEEFFRYFFSDEAVRFMESYHKKCGDKDFTSTSWNPSGDSEHVREVSFQHPVKMPLLSSFWSSCRETQKLHVHRNSHLIIHTCQNVSGAPYSDCFCVEGLWNVEKGGSQSTEGCTLNVHINVAFCKRTIMKGRIECATADECKNTYATWIDTAHELLKERKLKEEEEVEKEGVCRVEEEEEEEEEKTNVKIEEDMMGTGSATSPTSVLPSAAAVMRLFSCGKGQSQTPALLFAFVIIIFMQLSIVMLLSRPQHLHVISSQPEALTAPIGKHEDAGFLEKHIHHIHNEMIMIEARLEKMQQDHVNLEQAIRELQELLRN